MECSIDISRIIRSTGKLPRSFRTLWYLPGHSSRWHSSSFDNFPSSSTRRTPNGHLPVAPLRSRVQRQAVSLSPRIPVPSRGPGDVTNLRMGYRHLYPVPQRCRDLRAVLDFCPVCGRDYAWIRCWIVVRFISRFTQRSSATDFIFGQRVTGIAYSDVLQVYGMSRAGYVPQMSSLRVSTPIVIFELLKKAGARAFIYEPSSGLDLSGCPVPAYPAIQVSGQDVTEIVLPPLRMDHSASDLVFILHTSGSTGGSPKLVPCNRRWLDNIITRVRQTSQVFSVKGQDAILAM